MCLFMYMYAYNTLGYRFFELFVVVGLHMHYDSACSESSASARDFRIYREKDVYPTVT